MKKGMQLLGLILIVAFVLQSSKPQEALASSTLEKLNQAQQEKNETEGKLNEKKEELNGLQDAKNTLQVQLDGFNSELKKVTNSLEELEEKIRLKEDDIEKTRKELEEARATEEWQYDCMKKRIKFMYEQGESAYLELLFSSESFADFVNKTDYVNQISEYDRSQLLAFQETKERIEEEEALLVSQKEELDSYHEDVLKEQNRFASLVGSARSNLNANANEIAAAEQAALEYEAKIKEQENTIAALRKQYEAELALSRLAANSVWRDISQVNFEEGDRYLLASIIYCEAGGESYEGKVAVGSVVINRVLSSRYPDTVAGVIYQNKQFSPVGSGRFAIALQQGKATQSCYQAADEAMSGRSNVENCLYFRTPIEGVTPRYQIGGHIFY